MKLVLRKLFLRQGLPEANSMFDLTPSPFGRTAKAVRWARGEGQESKITK